MMGNNETLTMTPSDATQLSDLRATCAAWRAGACGLGEVLALTTAYGTSRWLAASRRLKAPAARLRLAHDLSEDEAERLLLGSLLAGAPLPATLPAAPVPPRAKPHPRTQSKKKRALDLPDPGVPGGQRLEGGALIYRRLNLALWPLGTTGGKRPRWLVLPLQGHRALLELGPLRLELRRGATRITPRVYVHPESGDTTPRPLERIVGPEHFVCCTAEWMGPQAHA